ncbi:6-carboxytetrahydropterin synthase QueD [Bacillus fonticola]|uniref:6-carboxytetrahydropterin synthase QueD n=1 Tax=Bacillus fonticola TaxID=2728853 RepID=UPI0014741C46|nr:6-carboxytetrahydropterin synthase QueD [Bacillus fonticola]
MNQLYPSPPPHESSYELNKDFHFAAAHYVPHEEAGACQRVHGHTYTCNVTVVGDELDNSGFLVNFKVLKELIHNRFDHRVLNEDEWFSDKHADRFPTTEVVARMVWETIQAHLNTLPHKPSCIQVFLRETPTSYVIYRPKKEAFAHDGK